MGCGASEKVPQPPKYVSKSDNDVHDNGVSLPPPTSSRGSTEGESVKERERRIQAGMVQLMQNNQSAAQQLISKTFRGMIGRNRAKKAKLWNAWNQLEFKEEQEQAESYVTYKKLKAAFVHRQTGGKFNENIDKYTTNDHDVKRTTIAEDSEGFDRDDISMDAKLLEAMTAVRSKHQLAKALKSKNSSFHKKKSMTLQTKGLLISELELRPGEGVTIEFANSIMDDFNNMKVLSRTLVIELLSRVPALYKEVPNVVPINFSDSQMKLTVVGDIHGQLADLLTIFKLNGMPAKHNHYLFNGDIVDRGENSMECLLLILTLKLLDPASICINRGNHECEDMVAKHGFEKECLSKYDREIFTLIIDVFSCLPIAHLIEEKILVVHGGLPQDDNVTIADINKINRHVPLLEPYSLMEDLLWSDPRDIQGRQSSARGAGCLFGEDAASLFMSTNGLELIVRSHECVDDGYETWFDEKVITIFSASNYCDVMENVGAFMLFDHTLDPTVVTFCAFDQAMLGPSGLRKVSTDMEREIVQKLVIRIAKNRDKLAAYFEAAHAGKDAIVTRTEWAAALRTVLQVELPFLLFQSQLGLPLLGVKGKPKGPVDYCDFLQQYEDLQTAYISRSLSADPMKKPDFSRPVSTVVPPAVKQLFELLYQNREQLDSLFRFFDTDGNGSVTLNEFIDAIFVLLSVLDKDIQCEQSQIESFAKSLDRNEDGNIDYDEFFSMFDSLDNALTHSMALVNSETKEISVDEIVVKEMETAKKVVQKKRTEPVPIVTRDVDKYIELGKKHVGKITGSPEKSPQVFKEEGKKMTTTNDDIHGKTLSFADQDEHIQQAVSNNDNDMETRVVNTAEPEPAAA